MTRKAEIPVSFPTKQAEKDLKKTENLFSRTISSIKRVEERTQVFSTLGQIGAGVAPAATGFLLQSPTMSSSSAALQSTGQGAQVGLTALLAKYGGVSGAIIGNLVGSVLNEFTQALGEEIRAVKDKSLQEVQQIAAQFAEVGASLSPEAIKVLLQEREKVNNRVFSAIKEVKNVQDANTNITETIKGASSRRLSDAMSWLGF